MKVANIHTRKLALPLEKAGILIDCLGSNHEKLWPKKQWPAMRLDKPLGIGAAGGHGPIRYFVSDYEPGRMVRFTFTKPRGFDGTHSFILEGESPVYCRLTHSITMKTSGLATIYWLLCIKPLHDALIEDSLFAAENYARAKEPIRKSWSLWVRMLRLMMRGGKFS